MSELIYMDNAATTYPKPAEMLDFMFDFYRRYGVSPGRSGTDMAVTAEETVTAARETLTAFFGGGGSPDRLVFTQNASDSLNMAIQGTLAPGDHVVHTDLDHNSVLRPVYHLQKAGRIEATRLPFDGQGRIDPDDVARAVRPNTRLVVLNHGSNALGTVQPVREVGAICRARDIPFAVDAAQTAGIIPIDMQEMGIDILCFTGHKSLMGPTGIGGMYVREGVTVNPIRYGGTGVRSEYPDHLEEYPWRLECGTLNVMGIAGLLAGVRWVQAEGLAAAYAREMRLTERLVQGIREIAGVTLYCADNLADHLPVISVNVAGMTANNVGTLLDVKFNVATRTGLLCTPRVHERLGTVETRGTVRFSLGPFNTEAHIDTALEGLRDIAERRGRQGS